MEKLHAKFQGLKADTLPSQRCFRRFMDLEFLNQDAKDDKSLISKKLTSEELSAVLKERTRMAWVCLYAKDPTAPYLYLKK